MREWMNRIICQKKLVEKVKIKYEKQNETHIPEQIHPVSLCSLLWMQSKHTISHWRTNAHPVADPSIGVGVGDPSRLSAETVASPGRNYKIIHKSLLSWSCKHISFFFLRNSLFRLLIFLTCYKKIKISLLRRVDPRFRNRQFDSKNIIYPMLAV